MSSDGDSPTRSRRSRGLGDRSGLHADVGCLRQHHRRGGDRGDPPRARPRHHLARHRRRLRQRAQRAARRPGDPRSPRRGRAGHQVRQRPRRRRAARRRSTAARSTCARPARPASGGSASTRSTSTSSIASIPTRRSRRPSGRWPSSSARARSATSASPRRWPPTCAAPRRCIPISSLQSEYSLLERGVEGEMLGACEELGIGFLPFSPLLRGLLAGSLTADSAARRGRLPQRRPLPARGPRAPVRQRAARRVVSEIADEHDGTPGRWRWPGCSAAVPGSCRSRAPSGSAYVEDNARRPSSA